MDKQGFIKFPDHFIWGAATAAYQIEGAVEADGRGVSIWDKFCQQPGAIYQEQHGREACQHYQRWQEDLSLLKDLGVQSYRFSIAWPRVLPQGRGAVNQAGLDFYERLVDGLLQAGIKPNCTLYHWDLPQALEDKGGWTQRETVYAYQEYVEAVARRLGTKIPMWATFNEPQCSAYLGYSIGVHAPGRKENDQVYNQVIHNLLLAHGLGVQTLRRLSPWAQVGLVHVLSALWPYPGRREDIEAAERQWRIENDWWMLPLLRAEYPLDVWEWKGEATPKVEHGDMEIIATPVDYFGLNYYARARVTHDPETRKKLLEGVYADAPAGAEFQDMPGWEIFPAGIENLLVQFTQRYGRMPLYVSENGMSQAADAPDAQGRVRDDKRIRYLRDHLTHCQRALQKGVDLRGYYVWSLMDNFEWALGYSQRFGIIHVNYNSFKRTPKDSFYWYQQAIRQRGFEDPGLPVTVSPFELAEKV